MAYDSTQDTKKHIKEIQKVFNNIFIPELKKRAENHDKSKLESPEKETYDKYVPMLKTAKYGSPEYYKIRESMAKEGLSHHYEVNRHHPEHFAGGVDGMNLVDVMEMFCDWYAASKRSDTGFEKGLETNKKNFKLDGQLFKILQNTYEDYLK